MTTWSKLTRCVGAFRYIDNREMELSSGRAPLGRATVGVAINQHGRRARLEIRGEMHGGRGLSDAALVRGDRNVHWV